MAEQLLAKPGADAVLVTIRARPQGQDRGLPGPGPMGGLGPGTVHLR